MTSIAQIDISDDKTAQAYILPLIERSPDIAERVAAQRPFRTATKLAAVIQKELVRLGDDETIQLFCAHPELAPDNPSAMTAESQSEQGRLNLTDSVGDERNRISELNVSYREKFGFPFITAVFRHEDMASVLAEFEDRLTGDKSTEIKTALDHIIAIMRSRVENSFGKSGNGA
ncbi:2-oxo-4-hydroxy-4-carboxy-5-ureidoimidazoline decarboxylase [Loktanella sp. Alg231-35]|uniref:2-oxo-4-hydroxy-4-carboxy-5-ureidoimidazoline decarboxylase n=1 Tax=Loktanella sp. Alg231-35 TaxID=1922220 RepID=UPI00131F0867|nr:2-oxo-4-hydroxy-4-carboxy-5-ureidoimidazoline decarboxylase [Loktanella sp. Alg231-35]